MESMRHLQVIGIILRLQGDYTKYCYFLFWWDSRAKQHRYVKKELVDSNRGRIRKKKN